MRIIGNTNWSLSSSTIPVAINGILVIVGLVFALKGTRKATPIKFISRDNNNSFEKSLRIPGLQNLENNCFLNVVLQALASCSGFQSFLQSAILECEIDEIIESMPLAVSLITLLEELSSVSEEMVTLSPRKLMHAMSHYIPNFDLTSQQDAAEAFLHLLSSLREESGGCYAPKMSTLADIFASNNRILTPIQTDSQTEQERWHRLFFGPFDGILSSSLTCQSCSSQISINLEHFDCLPLSPMLSNSFTIRIGCRLVDCLNQFIVAEHVENYNCSHCWHSAAIKYLTLMEGNKVEELEKLRRCSDQELCDCRKVYNLEKLPWSNRFSHALKQLSIARCPRILCIQLKRVHMNGFGESIKLPGHISFPLILDLSPFTTTSLGVKIQEVDVHSPPLNPQYNKRNPLPSYFDLHPEIKTLNFSGIYGEGREQNIAECLPVDGLVSTHRQALHNDNVFPSSGTPENVHIDTQVQSIDKVDDSCNLVSKEACLYQLVSVVEHFGRAGGGHYTAYRCVRMESSDVSGDYYNQQHSMRWFCVSDSEVHAVSVEDVLSAEASLLFYERIPNN